MVDLEDSIMTISINVNNYNYEADSSLYICNEVCDVNDPRNIAERIVFCDNHHLRQELLRHGILKLIKKYCPENIIKQIKKDGRFYYNGIEIAYKELKYKPQNGRDIG